LLQPPDNKKTGVPLPVNELVSHMGTLGIDIKSGIMEGESSNALLIRKKKGDPSNLFTNT
jgi:hypothetical protein